MTVDTVTLQTLRNVCDTAIRAGLFPYGSDNLLHAQTALGDADKALWGGDTKV